MSSPSPVRRSRRTRAHKASERPPPISRRQRRFQNDTQLTHSIETPLTPDDIKSLFETTSRTHFQRLSERPNARAWAAFMELDEPSQSSFLQSRRRQAAHAALQKVDRKIRHLFKHRPGYVKPLVKDVEQRVVALGPGAMLRLACPHATFRMVAHGVAQFYSLGHRSLAVGEERVTVIEKGFCEQVPEVSLLETIA